MIRRLWRQWQMDRRNAIADREHMAKLDALVREERLAKAGIIEVPVVDRDKASFDARMQRMHDAVEAQDFAAIARELHEHGDEPLPQASDDLIRANELGAARGRAEGQAAIAGALQTAISWIDKGHAADAKRLLEALVPRTTMDADWNEQQKSDLVEFAKAAGVQAPQFHRTTQAGGIHMYSDREDMIRDSLKEMAPADRLDTLSKAGVIVTGTSVGVGGPIPLEPVEQTPASWLDYEKMPPGRTVVIPIDPVIPTESDVEQKPPTFTARPTRTEDGT